MKSPLRPAILCIDDDESSLKIRKLLLEVSGYRVFTAVSGADGIEALAAGIAVDLVLLDYLMPGLNGDEVAKQLTKSSFVADYYVFSISRVARRSPSIGGLLSSEGRRPRHTTESSGRNGEKQKILRSAN